MIPKAMRAAVYYANDDVRLEERPVPGIGAGEILLRIRASGVCGSDVLEWYRKPKAPVVLGHEVAGDVAAVGKGVRGWKVGDRVVATHHVPCGKCRHCTSGHETVCETLRTTHFDPGGFCEYTRLTAEHVKSGLLKLPAKMSYEQGSFVEPLGCAVRGQRFAGVRRRQTVLVVGSGIAGILHVQLARTKSARVFSTDVDPFRLKMAERFGATAMDAREDVAARLRAQNEDRPADIVITTTGNAAALAQAFACVDAGGTVLFFAPMAPDASPPMPFNRLWRDEVRTVSSYGAAMPDLRESLRLIGAKKVDVAEMITHRLPLEETQKAFGLTAKPKESLKVVLQP